MDAIRRLITIFTLVFSALAFGSQSVAIIVPQERYPYTQVANAINQTLADASQSVAADLLTLDEFDQLSQPERHRYDLLVAIGSLAGQQVIASKPERPVIISFATRSALHAITRQAANNTYIQGIQIEQPGSRILDLITQLPLSINQVGAISSIASTPAYDRLSADASQYDITLNHQPLSERANPIRHINDVMTNSQAFLVLPDKAEFNRRIAKWVLYSSYRHKIPVIAYSQKYVEAGALISIFSTPIQLGQQTGELALATLATTKPTTTSPKFHVPEYFTIEINDAVRRSLTMPPIDTSQLKQTLKQAKHEGTRYE